MTNREAITLVAKEAIKNNYPGTFEQVFDYLKDRMDLVRVMFVLFGFDKKCN